MGGLSAISDRSSQTNSLTFSPRVWSGRSELGNGNSHKKHRSLVHYPLPPPPSTHFKLASAHPVSGLMYLLRMTTRFVSMVDQTDSPLGLKC